MKIIGMIPARGGSSRFNMKPLAPICGKPMLYWVWKHSKEVSRFDEVYVATDNEEIKAVAEGFGAKVLMTSTDPLVLKISETENCDGSSLLPVPMQEIMGIPYSCDLTARSIFALTVSIASAI